MFQRHRSTSAQIGQQTWSSIPHFRYPSMRRCIHLRSFFRLYYIECYGEYGSNTASDVTLVVNQLLYQLPNCAVSLLCQLQSRWMAYKLRVLHGGHIRCLFNVLILIIEFRMRILLLLLIAAVCINAGIFNWKSTGLGEKLKETFGGLSKVFFRVTSRTCLVYEISSFFSCF